MGLYTLVDSVSTFDTKKLIFVVYATYLIILSFVTFILYHSDKKKAIRGKYRIPEKVLLLSSLFGGAYGGFLAMKIFRHKTTAEHWYFTFINISGILLHTTLLIIVAFVLKI